MKKRQNVINISFREKDLYLLDELKEKSSKDYISTSRFVIDLIKKGIMYEELHKNDDLNEETILEKKINYLNKKLKEQMVARNNDKQISYLNEEILKLQTQKD